MKSTCKILGYKCSLNLHAEQSVVPRYGAVPGVGAATSCSSFRAGAGCDQRARGGAEWGTQSQQGNARALHPFHSMDTHIQAHVPVWQSSRLQAGTDVCFPSGTVRVLCWVWTRGKKDPWESNSLCSAGIPFVHALPRIHWYFCKDFIPDGRCQPVSFACERSRGAVVRFWCSLHVLSVLVPTSPVSAVFSSTPSLIGFH